MPCLPKEHLSAMWRIHDSDWSKSLTDFEDHARVQGRLGDSFRYISKA